MTITVKFFASLSEQLGKREVRLDFVQSTSLDHIWQQVSDGLTRPDNLLMAINMEYAKPDQLVEDGDEVAFFPPVTGG